MVPNNRGREPEAAMNLLARCGGGAGPAAVKHGGKWRRLRWQDQWRHVWAPCHGFAHLQRNDVVGFGPAEAPRYRVLGGAVYSLDAPLAELPVREL
jgi:hypothetical protein